MSEKKKNLSKFKKKLEEHDEKQAENAKLFNIDEVLGEIQSAEVPGVGVVEFGHLTLEDLKSKLFRKAKSNIEKAQAVLYLMLSKADSSITMEKVEKIPVHTASDIISVIAAPLLQNLENLKPGSTAAKKLS